MIGLARADTCYGVNPVAFDARGECMSENDPFFEQPILNSPYEFPRRHWELDEHGQPTRNIIESRRVASFVTPIPQSRRQRGAKAQQTMVLGDAEGLSTKSQQYELTTKINELRHELAKWRQLPQAEWKVTPETARLLEHWRNYPFPGVRPFFCQVEAAEAAIWLSEVAPQSTHLTHRFLNWMDAANREANPELNRLALKLATGAGKTTVMAMLIAWQTINAVRQPGSKKFTRAFLIVTPGITIKDRLRVLMPNDPDSYYKSRELVPTEFLHDIERAKIVITNYHAFKRRERLEISKGGRRLLQGRGGDEIETIESEGQMLQRVMPELIAMGKVMVINDEAHHCYREKPEPEDDTDLKGDEKKEAEKNNEAARLWISGIEALGRKLKIVRVLDLSATPFFLRGSGYGEGTLFPWTMSDFSLMDAIECGIVKLPRVPVADNLPSAEAELPMYRDLWKYIGKKMPKKGRGKAPATATVVLPPPLLSAMEALYGHYVKVFDMWQAERILVPPCFIIVCNNTATSKLIYDYIAGFRYVDANGSEHFVNGRLDLFRNFDANGEPLPRPNTLLIDSEQLESGEGLDDNFRTMAADEIERFRREIIERTGDRQRADNLSDQDLLREVMNTVGKEGQLGASIRCVVSVSMLTEGWDANTVTHILGVRAFGTQLLCEQVIGRALRRQSYDLNEDGLFNVEYADIFGIPFDFTAKPVPAPPQKPRQTVHVHAVRPDRDACEIEFPRVAGYRVAPKAQVLRADFTDDSRLELTPDLVGATATQNSGIVGQAIDLTLEHTGDIRKSTLVYEITQHLLMTRWRDGDDMPEMAFFGQLKPIVRRWLDECLICKGGTHPAQLKYKALMDLACERIQYAITRAEIDENPVEAILDPYNPRGSTTAINFTTSKPLRWQTQADRCHVNWAICDSEWELQFCQVLERDPRVRAYVKNQGLGFDVPYVMGGEARRYLPDFIVKLDDGRGDDDLLHLVVEIKGYRGEDAKQKAETMATYWVPGVNRLGRFGRWAFAELQDVYALDRDLEARLVEQFNGILKDVAAIAADPNEELD